MSVEGLLVQIKVELEQTDLKYVQVVKLLAIDLLHRVKMVAFLYLWCYELLPLVYVGFYMTLNCVLSLGNWNISSQTPL